MKKLKEDNFSFTKHVVKCSFYRYTIVSSPSRHREFLKAVQSLPREYDSDSYQSIINRFGTPFTTGVELGGKMKAVTAIRTCKAALSGLSETAVIDCLDVEASGTYNSVTVSTEFKHCQALKKKMSTDEKFSSMFNERESEIIGGKINGEDVLFSRNSHLQGPKCADYSASPMDTHLAKIFHSRNGILAKDMWKLQEAQNYSNNLYFKGYK
ncbi:hypothetical protein MHYP_G00345190 [Metynnis hypsauchen]